MFKKIKRKKALLVALALSFQVSPWAYAEETVPDFALETIVITDSKLVGEGEATKVTSLNIKDKIDAGQINSITDLLQDVPGITVTTSPQGGTTVTLRGVSGDRVLVAINGNVIDSQGPIMRGRALEWDSLPISNVKKIEIIRGASSAQYGGTLGGVINIVTTDTPGENKTYLKSSFGSYGDRKTSISNQGTTDNGKISWSVSADKKKSDGFYRNNFKDSHDTNLNLTYHFTDNQRLSVAITDSHREEGTLVGNNENPNNINGWNPHYPTVPIAPSNNMAPAKQYLDGSFREFDTRNYSLNYYEGNWKLGLYKNVQDRTDHLRYLNSTSVSTMTTQNTGYNWQQSRQLGNHKLIFGLDSRELEYKTATSRFETELNGYYLQDNWQMDDRVLLGLGLRYDHFEADNTLTSTNYADKSKVSPKLNVTYKLASNESVYASASRVFKAPPLSEFSKWASNYSPSQENLNNLDSNYNKYVNDNYGGDTNKFTLNDWQKKMGVLGTESGMAYELGWQKQFDDRFGAKVTGFYYDIDNYVTSYMGGSINSAPPPYNLGNAKIHGLEWTNDYQFSKNLGLIFSYTTQNGTKSGDRFDPTGTKLDSIPKGTVNLGLRYNDHQGFRAALDGQRIKPAKNTKTDSYTVFNLGMSYTMKKDQTVALAVNNLFDTDYEQTDGFPMPGRNYSLSYQIGF
ncbi:TonB-dependent receptor [Sporomusa sphaeroides]|jgi:outer membrane receptor protein involved in Fe transport|uniref:TonB-dependent receptor n=1 Tax=Sporomusa sphaeroides TaxID=47679 RepID=UPI003DA150DB